MNSLYLINLQISLDNPINWLDLITPSFFFVSIMFEKSNADNKLLIEDVSGNKNNNFPIVANKRCTA